MGLGTELSDEFKHRYNTNHPYGEVELFRTLIDSFFALRSYDITEIHGKRTIVEYTEDQNWFTRQARCELADIFFLVYSSCKKSARYFVMQNKIQMHKSCTEIHASLVQHELLATKKYFEYMKTHTKSHMLDRALHDSVCVYGNFYNSSSGMMDDMAVFTASRLRFKRKPPVLVSSPRPFREVEYRGTMDDAATMGMSASAKDFEGTDNLEKFGDLVEGLYIGEPVKRPVLREIVTMLSTLPGERYMNNSGKTVLELREELEALGRQLEYINDDGNVNDRKRETGMKRCREVIVINCDERKFG